MAGRTYRWSLGVAAATALAAGAFVGWRWFADQGQRRYTFRERGVLITGGSRGLGLVLARRLAREGARLGLLARDADELERAAEELREAGAHVATVPCDLRDADQLRRAVDRIADDLGGLDMVINNAGVIQVGPMEHMTEKDYAQAIELYAWAPLRVITRALPHLQRRPEARIVNICSIGGKVAIPHLLPYTVGKFAEVGLSDGTRAELKRYNIHVTTVIPGLMRTGSPGHALFKGKHRKEHAWFAIGDALPGVAIGVDRAAKQIIEAARRRAPALYITPQARLLAVANETAPSLVAWIAARVNRMLPSPTAERETTSHTGFESRSGWAPSLLTRMGDQAAERNNEGPDV
ncbi:MAG: SDR family oxidoreductase [Phycisphaeraceae bacterium]